MGNLTDLKPGKIVKLNDEPYLITRSDFKRKEAQKPVMRTKLKNLKTGAALDKTFNAGENFEFADMRNEKVQFLYKDEMGYHFMDSSTFEQVNIPESLISNPQLLKDGQEVEIVYHAETETALTCELPPFVELKITYTEPGLKGDTATNASKPATLETGAEIQVPLFINQDELIKVDTRTNSYAERVK